MTDIVKRLAEMAADMLGPYRRLTIEAIAEIERLRGKRQLICEGCRRLAEVAEENERLRALIRTMVEEDPNDLAADGGITVLDVWRKQARAALEGK